MKSTFSVLFFVKKDKQKINGSYPIFVRITIDGVASRFNSKLDVQPKLWDGKAGKAAGRSACLLYTPSIYLHIMKYG